MTDMSEIIYRPMPPECFTGQQLRDGIAERLERLQQAAHPHLANLLGIQFEEGKAFIAWEASDGRAWAEVVDQVSDDQLRRIMRNLIGAVESLHALGLVHGDLNPRNIYVANDEVCLSEASPLLLTDPQIDVLAVAGILRDALQRRKMTQMAAALHGKQLTLRNIASLLDGAYVPLGSAEDETNLKLKRNTLVWAIVLALLAIVAAMLVRWYMLRPGSGIIQSDLQLIYFA